MAKLLQQNPNIAQVEFVCLRFYTNSYIRSLLGRFRLNLNWLRWVTLIILIVHWASHPTPNPQTLGLFVFMTHEKQILPPSPPYPAAPLGLLELLKDLSCKTDNLFTQHRCLLACFAQWPPLRPWSSIQPRDWNLWMAGHPHWRGLQSRR